MFTSFTKLHVNNFLIKFINQLEILFAWLTYPSLEIKFTIIVSSKEFEHIVFEIIGALSLLLLLSLVAIFFRDVFVAMRLSTDS